MLEAELGRQLVVIAESDLNQPRIVTPREAGGYGLDAQWSDDFHHALHTVLTGESAGYLADFGSIALLAKCSDARLRVRRIIFESRGRRHGAPVSDSRHIASSRLSRITIRSVIARGASALGIW